MGIDFLDRNEKEKKREKQSEDIVLHIPKEEPKKREPVRKKIERKREERVKRKTEAVLKKKGKVNLVSAWGSQRTRRRLLFVAVSAILLVLVATGTYILYTLRGSTTQSQSQSQSQAQVQRQGADSNQQLIQQEIAQPVSESTESVIEEAVLPDTELAPLRGALVRFPGNPIIYLVEDNGELRRVELQSVVFDNGQRISQIDLSLLYLINPKWESIRKGKDVRGQVDWDPRVLLPGELSEFL